jgi:hypothetical protein
MNAPDGKFNAAALQGFSPSQHVLIDTVHQRAIKIEKESRCIPRMLRHVATLRTLYSMGRTSFPFSD